MPLKRNAFQNSVILISLFILLFIIKGKGYVEGYVVKTKASPVINTTELKKIKNGRHKVHLMSNVQNEVIPIISSAENENYIKQKIKEFEKYRVTNYSSKCTFFFPGQGEQYVSMGSSSYDKCKKVREIYERANKILGYNLMELINNGSEEQLKDSEIAQPAIFVVSLAAYEKLKEEKREDVEQLSLCMGYSLGEYSALACSGCISLEDGVYLTKERGKAMQNAAKLHNMTTVAVVGLNLETIKQLIKDVNVEKKEDILIVSYMTDTKFGLCGKTENMEYLEKLAKEKYNAKFTKRLQISGAFHSAYMHPAKQTLENVLNQIQMKKLNVPVLSNVDGNAYDDPFIIKHLLTLQLTSPINIFSCLQNVLKNGYEKGYELGPGKINTNLLKDLSKKTKNVIPYI